MRHCSVCCIDTEGGIWCSVCSKAYDRGEAREILSSLKIHSFSGGASLNPRVEAFYESGDPAVLDRSGAGAV